MKCADGERGIGRCVWYKEKEERRWNYREKRLKVALGYDYYQR